MPRKKDTLEHRNRRFLLPLFKLTFPSLIFLFAIAKISSAICGLATFGGASSACAFQTPSLITIGLVTSALIGGITSAWRFYRDYICHERFDGYF